MNEAVYHRRLARVLDRMGGLYTLNDILERIADGRMQSFAEGNSWLITEINLYPRARALDCLALVGDLRDGEALHDQALAFANRIDASLIRAYGRRGWIPQAKAHGWRLHTVNQVYHKDM
jgi:hypothetical protein